MEMILVPGLWLDATSWDRVVPGLERAGHTAHPLTLPGMARDANRSQITVADHIAAVVDAIDACSEPVRLVGHSAGAGIASAAVDARPDRVARAVYVGGFPALDGEPLLDGFTAVDGEVALPSWEQLGEEDLAGLDDGERARFRERSIPAPEHVLIDPVSVSDERRLDVPVTAVCTEYDAATLQKWIADGMAPVRGFTLLRDVTYVDLPTGHWPQFSRPEDLAAVLVAEAAR